MIGESDIDSFLFNLVMQTHKNASTACPSSGRKPAYSSGPIAETRKLIDQVADGTNKSMIEAVHGRLDEVSYLHRELVLDEETEKRLQATTIALKKMVVDLEAENNKLQVKLQAKLQAELAWKKDTTALKEYLEISCAKLVTDVASALEKSKESQCICKEEDVKAEAARRELVALKVRYGMLSGKDAKKEIGDEEFNPPPCVFTPLQIWKIKSWISDK